ncbi:histidine ammonia-lyase [Streptomyces capoamus]|uniref:Histidine ammonia-lyase n=1 Tax=Streptomyces capoamus TaxID=68183 RepID=A0A919C1R3_9ACTN|nr:histidine ammonia-lyase [Streptomyces capoamus]GGW17474.1 histidine ammonia-lyase [Streptomyces libani subsp. rufus]GHG36664.1 histidine ammonia-lyase [Streptomyces capoamus]
MHTVVVGTSGVTASDVLAVARGGARIELSAEAVAALAAAREIVDALAAKPDPVYGVSTGFGALATRHISPELRAQLQRNIVRSHAAGMGPRVERELVRALMFLRLKTVCSGHTGVRPEVAQTMADVLNAGITPVVHEYGSLGCSGDLAPLSHCALALMGEGDAEGPDGVVRPAGELLAEHGIQPVELREKEGLALLNGTDGMLGMLVMALADLDTLYKSADVTAALSLEALLGTDKVLAPELHAIRPHPGQGASAANMSAVLQGSGLTGHHQDDAPRVQDAYSVRCAPQVAGAGRDTLAHARTVAERELAAAVDNPVVLPGVGTGGGRVESNGNFHGAPVAYVLDFLAIAAADLGSIAERRTDRLLDKNRSHGLPPFLADDAGVDSGLMIAQYTQAALVSEMKRLAVPASADSIPSSAMQEDHVSMGWSAARKLRTAVDNLTRIIAIELYAATRAVELREGLTPAPATRAVIEAVRAAGVQGPGPDRFLAPDLAAADAFVRGGDLVAAVEKVTGPLQ